MHSSYLQASAHQRTCLQLTRIRRFPIVEPAKLQENRELGQIFDCVLQGLFQSVELDHSVALLHIFHMAPVDEQQSAELVECVHEVGQRLLDFFVRIGSLYKKLEHLCVEHFLHTGLGSILDDLHISDILLGSPLHVFLCDGRRILRNLGVADIGRLPHVALRNLCGRLGESVGVGHRLGNTACTGSLDDLFRL